MASPDLRYTNLRGAFTTVLREEGYKGLYRGLGAGLLAVPLFWSVYFPVYQASRRALFDKVSWRPFMQNMFAAVVAGAVADVVTNPLWVVRLRLQTLVFHNRAEVSSPPGALRMLIGIWRSEGFLALYKGLSAS